MKQLFQLYCTIIINPYRMHAIRTTKTNVGSIETYHSAKITCAIPQPPQTTCVTFKYNPVQAFLKKKKFNKVIYHPEPQTPLYKLPTFYQNRDDRFIQKKIKEKLWNDSKIHRYEQIINMSNILSLKRSQLIQSIDKRTLTNYAKAGRATQILQFKRINYQVESRKIISNMSPEEQELLIHLPKNKVILQKKYQQQKIQQVIEVNTNANNQQKNQIKQQEKQCFKHSKIILNVQKQRNNSPKMYQTSNKFLHSTPKLFKLPQKSTLFCRKNKIPTECTEPPLQATQQTSKTLPSPPQNICANAYIVYETTQKPLLQSLRQIRIAQTHAASNHKTAFQMASLTKIMTCIVTIQVCVAQKINTQVQKIKITSFETNTIGTTANLQPGQIYSIQQLLYGLMLPSGNDASVALAVWVGKLLLTKENKDKNTVQCKYNTLRTALRFNKFPPNRCYNRFLAEMNKKARILNLDKTSYANSHGLNNALNKSSCLDIAILCEYAMQNQHFKKIVGCRKYVGEIKKEIRTEEEEESEEEAVKETAERTVLELKSQSVEWENTHQLVQKSEEYVGIKTGVTTAAGPCLASCLITKDQRTFIIVVLGCRKLNDRFRDTETLKKWLYKKEGIIKDKKYIKQLTDSRLPL